MDLFSTVVQSLIVGCVAWGGLRVELRFLRRDIDEVRNFIWRERNHGNKKAQG